MTLGDPGAGRGLGSGVERASSDACLYLCSDDVVELLERLDEYINDPVYRLVTMDRTNDGQYYAFLVVDQGR